MNTIDTVKAGAKRLRAFLDTKSLKLGHSDSLEAMAKTHGHRDWNAMSAALLSEQIFLPRLGDRVKGSFQNQKLAGMVTGLQMLNPKPKHAPEALKVRIKFNAPVDVVTSEHMEGLRSYMWLYLDGQGHTIDRLGRADGKGCFKITG